MKTIKNIYKIGYGPSSSHTMGPQKASEIMKQKYPQAFFKVTLFGSLALSGKGHLTDYIINKTLNNNCEIIFDYHTTNLKHPNTLLFEVIDNQKIIESVYFYSIGGGNIQSSNKEYDDNLGIDKYPEANLTEVLAYLNNHNLDFVQYVDLKEDADIDDYLRKVYQTMKDAFYRGIQNDDFLPNGGIIDFRVQRRAKSFYQKYQEKNDLQALVYAVALSLSEENASGGLIVTSPTCGSCGIVPAVLIYQEIVNKREIKDIINALKVAGLIGEIVRSNASISGAEVGCQGEVGVACSMAAAANCYLAGGTIKQIEYAAEIALEHHLGLTCDPIHGLVQIPCIERNAIASAKAIDASKYAILTDGEHKISFDYVVETMKETGLDMKKGYKETALKGLAKGRKSK